jgi:hypothetical protein
MDQPLQQKASCRTINAAGTALGSAAAHLFQENRMTTPTMTPRSPHEKPDRRRLLYGASALVLLGCTVGAAMWLGNRGPEPGDDLADVAKYVASDEFREETPERRREFTSRVREDMSAAMEAVPEEERRQLARNTMREAMGERMDGFFKAPTQEERDAILDDTLDRMQERRANRPQTRPAEGDRERGEGRGRGDGDRADRGPRGGGGGGAANPARRAQRAEFIAALRQRAEERGIDMPRGGPGGRGGR